MRIVIASVALALALVACSGHVDFDTPIGNVEIGYLSTSGPWVRLERCDPAVYGMCQVDGISSYRAYCYKRVIDPYRGSWPC